MKWIAIQPLIGGMLLGAKEALGTWPQYIISQGTPNEEHLNNYLNKKEANVPYVLMDSEYKEFIEISINFDDDVDIVIGVPVCSGLSLANCSTTGPNARGANAEQNNNMYNIAELSLSKIKPKCYIFENAPGLYTKMGEPVVDKLYRIGKKYGYSMSLIKTDTFLHGIPQHRKRTFGIFWKSENAPLLNYYNKENKGLEEYLKKIKNNDNPINNLNDDIYYKYLFNKFKHNFRKELLKYKTGMNTITRLNLWDDFGIFCKENNYENGIKTKNHVIKKLNAGESYWDSSMLLFNNYVNGVIGKSMNKLLHPIEDRFLSIRELLYLMGMPEDFVLNDSKRNYNHIAQNVPVTTARDWVLECKKFINGELSFSNVDFIKQNNEKQKIDTNNIGLQNNSFDLFFNKGD